MAADNKTYTEQVRLLLNVLPLVGQLTDFALKGGTAINFFVRDLPRLSVDIDLTYLEIADRANSLAAIEKGMRELGAATKKLMPASRITPHHYSGSISSLLVSHDGVQIKIEPNFVLRGTVFPVEERELCAAAQSLFQLSLTAKLVSFADLYGGKICAALDRQHPRDLFDIKLLLENEGITENVRKAFIVYLAAHNRPMHELLQPAYLDFRQAYENEFAGMTRIAVEYHELENARVSLAQQLKAGLSTEERAFLISIKEGQPDWGKLNIPGIELLPGIQWKLMNIAKMDKKKHAEMLAKLKRALGY